MEQLRQLLIYGFFLVAVALKQLFPKFGFAEKVSKPYPSYQVGH
jgi:hypothetical protein